MSKNSPFRNPAFLVSTLRAAINLLLNQHCRLDDECLNSKWG